MGSPPTPRGYDAVVGSAWCSARSLSCSWCSAVTGGAVAVAYGLYYVSNDLPDFQRIANYVPAVGSKVYDADGKLIAEFETERRIPVSIGEVPTLVVNAFLAAEDRDFYSHKGVDPQAIFRAAVADIARYRSGQRPIGASTITQQVVRHFLLSRELSITRKAKEAILAYQLDKRLSKDRILEIYLNEIYFGAGAYGVGAAADTYFQKKLDQLTPAEAAFLAALPKAPNNYHPIRNAAAAKARRNWVLASMAELGWLGDDDAKRAIAEPLHVNMRPEPPRAFGYFVEEVRRGLLGRYGDKAVYEGGLTIRTSYTPAQQRIAEKAFRNGLIEYDRRHGWRGPIARLGSAAAARKALAETPDPPGSGEWRLAAVTETDAAEAKIVLRDGSVGEIPISELRWARPTIKNQLLGPGVRRVGDVLQAGDLALVEPISGKARKGEAKQYGLRQIPDASGGLVVMDPKTGRIFALVGGWSFQQSQFNRSTQAQRQPGSAIKPFVYLTALQDGYTLSSTVDDTPLEVSQGPGLPPWRPANYDGDYNGAMTLENALIHSRNLATAHLALDVGMRAIAGTVQAFDIMDRMPLYPSMALGAGETTLLRLTNAYAMLDNGGHWLVPSVIDTVQDRQRSGHLPEGARRLSVLLRRRRTAGRRQCQPAVPPDRSAGLVRDRRIRRCLGREPDRVRAGKARSAGRPECHSRHRRDIAAGHPARHGNLDQADHQGSRAAARRQDRHDEQLFRCLVCRLFAGSGCRHLCRLRRAAHAGGWRDRRPRRRRYFPRLYARGA